MINPLSNPSYLLPPLLTVVVTLVLIAIIFLWARRSFSTWIFCGLLISVGLWSLLIFGMRSSPDIYHAVAWDKALSVPAFAVFVLYYHFTLAYTNTTGQRSILLVSYFLLVVIAALAPTNILIEGMRLEYYGYAPLLSPISLALFAAGPLLILGGTYNILRRYWASSSDEEKNRLIYLAIAAIFPVLGAGLDGFSDLPPVSIWCNLIFSILCTVAILKYHLLDIRVAVRKSLVYLLISAGIAVPYLSLLYSLHYIFEPKLGPWWIHALIILLFAIILRPLYSSVQQFVDRLFYRDRYDYLRALQRFSRQAQSIVNLEELVSSMVKLVGGALRTSSVCLLLPSEEKRGLVMASSTGLEEPLSGVVLRDSSPLVKWLELHGDILSAEQLNVVPQLQSFSLKEKNNLERMGAKIYVPIKTRQGQLSGILVLGQKLSEQSYSGEDKQLLTALTNQMGMALENARLYEETRESERVLRESEEFSSSLLNNSPNPMLVINPDTSVRYINPKLERLTGFSSAEIIGRKAPYPWWIEETLERTNRDLEEAMRKGARGLEELFQKKDGEQFWVEITSTTVTIDGEFKYYLANWVDITERKQAEKALRDSEERLRAIFDGVQDAIFTKDHEGHYTHLNSACASVFGLTVDEVIGKTDFDFFPPEVAHHIWDEIDQRVLQGGEVVTIEDTKPTASGMRTFHVIKVPIRDENGAIEGLLGVARDITERKQAQEREKKLQQELYLSSRLASIGQLAAGVAHEINNPLTGILGFSQRLLRKSTDEEFSRGLEIIRSEAQRAAKVVQNLLTFARYREPTKEYSDINDILQKALELRAYELKTSNIEIVTDLAPSLPMTIADFQQLEEVFLNIIINAEQAMTETNREGKLTIKTQEITGNIRVSFTDDGPGIPAEQLDKLFDPFFTTRGEVGGTGLGLSICHGIVVEHGGKIHARSKPGEGTTFIVELPVITEESDKTKIVEE